MFEYMKHTQIFPRISCQFIPGFSCVASLFHVLAALRFNVFVLGFASFSISACTYHVNYIGYLLIINSGQILILELQL